MINNKTVSVCIPTYNGERYIKQQLDSIIIQLDTGDEIIISDDTSTDRTVEIIKGYSDPRIKLLENGKYQSPIFNLENALNHAKGEYIFLADQDDVWLKDKIFKTLPYLKKYDMTVSDCFVTNSNGDIIINSFFEFNNSKKGLINNLIKNNYIGCCMAFNRNVLEKAIPFPKKIPLHDLWIGFVTELFYKTIFINEKLIMYRRHENAISFTGGISKYGIFKKIAFRLNCIRYIPLIIMR